MDKISKGNKLIGEFMKLKAGRVMSGKPIFIIDGSFYGYERLEYHSSWDWLVPVAIKLGMGTISTDINKAYNEVLEKIDIANTKRKMGTTGAI
jgi:hypothetical protein